MDEVAERHSHVEWGSLVERIRTRDAGAMEELYSLFESGLRQYFVRQVGPQEAEDHIHEVFLSVIQAIRREQLREPERLMGFIRTIAHRRVAAHIHTAVHARRNNTSIDTGIPISDAAPTPEQTATSREKIALMASTLRGMSPRDREILTRFYLDEQTPEQICAEMNLTHTQFRLLKSRAKAKFADKGKLRIRENWRTGILERAFSDFPH